MKLLIDGVEIPWPRKIEIQVEEEIEQVPALEIAIHGGKLWVRAPAGGAALHIETKNLGAGLVFEDREVVCSRLPPAIPRAYGIKIVAGNTTGDGIRAVSSPANMPQPDAVQED